jgi:asparagine synthase (glutamine-hydrolysing)
MVGGGASRLLPVGFRGRNHLIGLSGNGPQGVAHVNLYFDAATRRRLLAPLYGARLLKIGEAERVKAELCRPGASLLRQATAVDFQTYLVDDILVKVDRASMLASLEVRAPFLDAALIEFAFTCIPDHLRADGEGGLKILPRRLAQRLLPPEFDRDRKQGFSIPLAKWFRGDWGRFIESVLSEADRDLFEPFVIRKLIAGQRRGYANTQRLFALTMFELWRRHYGVTL